MAVRSHIRDMAEPTELAAGWRDFSLESRTAIVTGSSTGIGRAIAASLVELGACVAVTALPEERARADEVAAALDPSGARTRAYGLDVRSHASITAMQSEFVRDFGGVDILVNNASVRLVESSLATSSDAWDELMAVNLRGVFLSSQVAAHHMRGRGGSIVNISSQLGLVAAKDRAAYCASKAGVINLSRALALDWAPYRIRVNAVAPGTTRTESTPVATDAREAAELLSRMPLGRPIEPVDVANAVVYLAGPLSDGVTGHTLVVDGGWTLS
ncbi:MAG TPA: glucose 1-dehydrogenase [Thermoleophilaceae bacterium]|jgi:2-deoxy-D-gluconate 3-dehydrogenase